MRNRWITLLGGLIAVSGLSAQAVEPASVFLDSAPLGARIVLDGTMLPDRTPTLVRGLPAGTHTVTFWKDGFLEVDQKFTVAEGKTPSVHAVLPPESVVLSFPVSDEVKSTQQSQAAPGRQFRYPAGAYFLSGTGESVRLTPIFPDADLLDASGWASTVATLGALTSIGLDVWAWKQGGPARPSALTAALSSAALGELAWNVALQTRKSRFYRESAPTMTPEPERLDRALVLSAEADAALDAGDLSAAERSLALLVRNFPDSALLPSAWFRLARIHSVTGRQDLALGEYRLVAETFPQAAYHDRARQALVDLYEATNRPELALYHLDRLVLTDGFFDKDTVEAQRTRLTAAAPVPAEPEAEAVTPRQAFDRVAALFGEGHAFTASELAGFPALRDALQDRDDKDLADTLDLIRVANAAADPQSRSLGEDRSAWEARDALRTNRLSWLGVRDSGLIVFRLAAATGVFAAALYDRSPTPAALWTAGGAMATMGLSLFPLLWAEPRQ